MKNKFFFFYNFIYLIKFKYQKDRKKIYSNAGANCIKPYSPVSRHFGFFSCNSSAQPSGKPLTTSALIVRNVHKFVGRKSTYSKAKLVNSIKKYIP